MATEYNVCGKKVLIDVDGEVFVDGSFAGLKKSLTSTMWMNGGGIEIKDLEGKTLEEVLLYMGKNITLFYKEECSIYLQPETQKNANLWSDSFSGLAAKNNGNVPSL